jgi:hypothetical protein
VVRIDRDRWAPGSRDQLGLGSTRQRSCCCRSRGSACPWGSHTTSRESRCCLGEAPCGVQVLASRFGFSLSSLRYRSTCSP